MAKGSDIGDCSDMTTYSDKAGVVIVRTGVANTASVRAAFERLGRSCVLTDDPSLVAGAALLVLPGVGSFAAGMSALSRAGLVEILRERIGASRPTLAICLGLQLLCTASAESPGVAGLALIDHDVARFDARARTPQFGWNLVRPAASDPDLTPRTSTDSPRFMLEAGHAYFANSYRLAHAPAGWIASWSEHAGPFVAALERGSVLACQFHPELSGAFGASILRRWVECATTGEAPARREDARC